MHHAYSPQWKHFSNWVTKNPETARQSYEDVLNQVAQSPAKYKGKPVEFLYQPFFFTDAQWQALEQINQTMMGIMAKVICHYVENPDFRRHFGFPPLMEQLILKEPGYPHPVPVTRIDLFYHLETGDFQFCEINTDGSSGMVEARELQRIIGGSQAMDGLSHRAEGVHQGEFFNSWVTALMENYQEWCRHQGRQPSDYPRVAIVDLFSKEPPSEFYEFKKAFEDRGYPCQVVDARALTLEEGRLTAGGQVVDVVYRRLVTWELVEHEAEIKPFVQAILDDAVCLVGPVRSQIPHNKLFFAVLHDEEATSFLDQQERGFIRQHVPYTARLRRDNEEQWQHWLNNKDRLIIKPDDRYASFGVCAGKDVSPEEWEEKLNGALSQSYLVQQYCNVPQVDMAFFTKQGVDFRPFYYLVGCFVYNGVFQGPYIRVGSHSIIGSVVECFTVPAFRE